MSSLTPVPFPIDQRMVKVKRDSYFSRGEKEDPQAGFPSDAIIAWATQLGLVTGAAPTRIGGSGPLTDQSASIAATDMTDGAISSGLYSIAHYAQIVIPASVSSSLTITYDWTYGGQPQTFSFPAITGNLVTTNQSDGLPLIFADANTPIRYSAAYVSVGTAMKYDLYVELSSVRA